MKIIFTIIALVGLMLAWVGVQYLWRNTFADYIQDDDVLADRRSCGNCGCGSMSCQRKDEGNSTSPSQLIKHPKL